MPVDLQNALERVELLGSISDDEEGLTRTFLSPANKRAAEQVIDWMNALGMETSHTVDGSVRGVLPGTNPEASPLLLGSHLDTVINAGKYDGALGIITALAAVDALAEEGVSLPFPVHILGFSDEEGVRFQTTYLGSKSMVAPLDRATLDSTDREGRTLASILENEGWHEKAAEIRYAPGHPRGYVELHIEQGRVLEEAGEAAAIVSGIAGQARVLATVTGRADHAGTTPMSLRQDALTGAAECILAIEHLARTHEDLVATVGMLDIQPGASNSIPQSVKFTVDLRHPDDTQRNNNLAAVHKECEALLSARELSLTWQTIQDNDAVPCDPQLSESLLNALEASTGQRRLMASGAGHDGVAISALAPIGMIFLRCRDGLSHHPDEYTAPEDIAVGIDVLTRFLKSLSN